MFSSSTHPITTPPSQPSLVPDPGVATPPPPDTAGEFVVELQLLHSTTRPRPSSPLPADIVEALNHQLDAKWRHFGTFLRVDYQTMNIIETSLRGKPEDCMLDLLGRWTSNQAGTGTLPRTWQTVVEAVKSTGFPVIAENLAHQHGVNRSQ